VFDMLYTDAEQALDGSEWYQDSDNFITQQDVIRNVYPEVKALKEEE
jgi:hypothetical protein